MIKPEVEVPHFDAASTAVTAEIAHHREIPEHDSRGEFPEARAVLMGIRDRESRDCWKEYDVRLARVQQLEREFVDRMTGIFPKQELNSEDIAEMAKRNLGVVSAISKATMGQFFETRRDESTIADIRTSLEAVRIAQASAMLGIDEWAQIEDIRNTISRRLPEAIPEHALMSVYCALGIPQHFQSREQI